MSVETTTSALAAIADKFPSERDELLSDQTRMQDYRIQQVNLLFAERAAQARALVATLWGEIDIDNNYVRTLSPSGECWRLYHMRERQLADAQETAQREAINPAYIAHSRMRAEAIIAGLTPDDDFLKLYQKASQDEQRALQDYAPSLFNHSPFAKDGKVAQWLAQLTLDRQQRLNTPAVQSAMAALEQATSFLLSARAETKRAANMFASVGTSDAYPYPIGEYLNGVNVLTAIGDSAGELFYDFRMKSWGNVIRVNDTLVFGG